MPRNLNVQPKQFEPVQLKLFMGAQEWQGSVTDSFDRWTHKDETMDELWRSKLHEAKQKSGVHGAGVYDSIKAVGYYHEHPDVMEPPTIQITSRGTLTQGEGHHRIAAAAEIEKETGKPIWIPTNYTAREQF
jgi:hypothetical protein